MSKIVLAPYSTRLSANRPNPKNYPDWPLVVCRLADSGHEVIQIGGLGEERIVGVSQFIINWPLKKLRQVIEDADTWISVDSWLPHFVWAEKLNKRGVCIFSLSDPLIWGHPENINLLRDRKYVREFQYQGWNEAIYNPEAFVSPEVVINAITSLLRPTDRTRLIPASVSLALETEKESFIF